MLQKSNKHVTLHIFRAQHISEFHVGDRLVFLMNARHVVVHRNVIYGAVFSAVFFDKIVNFIAVDNASCNLVQTLTFVIFP